MNKEHVRALLQLTKDQPLSALEIKALALRHLVSDPDNPLLRDQNRRLLELYMNAAGIKDDYYYQNTIADNFWAGYVEGFKYGSLNDHPNPPMYYPVSLPSMVIYPKSIIDDFSVIMGYQKGQKELI